MKIGKMNRFLQALPALFLCTCSALASADEADEYILQSCSGLSQYFYSNSKNFGGDAIDMEVMQKIVTPDVAGLVLRAKIAGAAHACGEQTAEVLEGLETRAAAVFGKDSQQSKRLVQVIVCTEARFRKIGLRGNWAVTTLEFCPQALQNFDFFIKKNNSFDKEAPRVTPPN
ncbi:MAG TPA: hypothetical protein VIF60_21220 [Burkholderiaceae bacterium]|jgi:hypothetical protein